MQKRGNFKKVYAIIISRNGKKRCIFMNNEELIKAKLNYMTILDFKENYNKSEIERILNLSNEEIIKTKMELKDILSSMYDTNKYHFVISSNFISIDEIIEKKENSMMTREYKKIWSDNFNKLPRQWVMGKKVGKKCMEETLKEMI